MNAISKAERKSRMENQSKSIGYHGCGCQIEARSKGDLETCCKKKQRFQRFLSNTRVFNDSPVILLEVNTMSHIIAEDWV